MTNHAEYMRDYRKKLKGNSYKFFKWLLARPRRSIRVLCHNCNCAHGFYGYCPHEKE